MLKTNLKFNLLVRIAFLSFIIVFFILINQVSANYIENINMDIFIDDNGNAIVTEVWEANLTKGTEGYRPYTELGNLSISDFSVTDQTGTIYETLPTWNTSSTFAYKSYKCGINNISNGVELCWGISNYGYNTYTLKYNINNFVTQYTDTQGIYWNFLNINQSVSNVKITIYSNYKISLDNARIWAFGYNGTINFVDGKIVLESGGYLASSQYMTGLVRFESDMFNTENISFQSFDDIYNSAMSTVVYNSNYNNNDNDNGVAELTSLLIKASLGTSFLIILAIVLVRTPIKMKYNNRYNTVYKKLDLGELIKSNEITYFRDIPCNGDLFYTYWIIEKYKIVPENKSKNALIGAILLKWIKEGYIEIPKVEDGLFNIKDNKYNIIFKRVDTFSKLDINERRLMLIFRKASGDNNILEMKEFEKWCKVNFREINKWFDGIQYDTTMKLKDRELILEENIILKRLWRKKVIVNRYVDNSIREDALNLMGLKKFLLDYSLVQNRQNMEVHIIEDYLIYAQLLGIADKVEEQFSKLYPDFYEISKINVRNISLYTYNLGFDIMSTIEKETIRHERQVRREARREARRASLYSSSYSGSDSSSGGGGSSYSSGGDSAGGSSGGGFR